MGTSTDLEMDGARGMIAVRVWPNGGARYAVLLAHGYGEHTGRYEHVGAHLVAHGGAVYAPDHYGHGRSEGERALVHDLEDMVGDLHLVADRLRADLPGLPLVLIGHSMGGLIAARFVQRYRDEIAAVVLSGPAVGGNPAFQQLLAMDPIPEIPIDPAMLSRDRAVGEAYAADELVYHGPFHRATLQSLFAAIASIAEGPDFGDLPTLWLHGDQDMLVPLAVTRPVVERLGGSKLETHVYQGAAHEVFNETNRNEVLSTMTRFIDQSLGS